MAKTTTISCPSGVPTRLTDDPVTACRVQGMQEFHLLATLDTTAPTSTDGSVFLLPFSVLGMDRLLVHFFGGVGATVHLWAWPLSGNVDVSVSHQ